MMGMKLDRPIMKISIGACNNESVTSAILVDMTVGDDTGLTWISSLDGQMSRRKTGLPSAL